MVRMQAWQLVLMLAVGCSAKQCSKTCQPHMFDWGGGCPATSGMGCSAGVGSKGLCQCGDGQTCASDSSICKVITAPDPRNCNETTCTPTLTDWARGCKGGQICSAHYPYQGICQCPLGTTCTSGGVCQAYKVPEARDCKSTCTPSSVNWNGGCKSGQSCSTRTGTGVCQCGGGQTCSADSSVCQVVKQPEPRDCNHTTCMPTITDWAGGCKNSQTCSASIGLQGVCQCPVSTTCTSKGICESTKAPELEDCHTTCIVSLFDPLGGCQFGQACSAKTGVGKCQCSKGKHCSADGAHCSVASSNESWDCNTECAPTLLDWNGGCMLGQTCSDVWPSKGHCYCNSQQDRCSADGRSCIHPTAQMWEKNKVWASNLMSLAPPIVLVPAGLVAAVMLTMAVRKYKQRPGAGAARLLSTDIDNTEIENPGATAE